jgi:hypothetical protein
LAHAIAFAKPSYDLREALKRNRKLNQVAVANMSRRPRARKLGRLPLAGQAAMHRVQTFPKGGGRPSDAFKHNLLRDIHVALDRHNIPGGYWSTGEETLLKKVYRACAEIAGVKKDGDLQGVWRNARKIRKL